MKPLPENHGLTLPEGVHPRRPWWGVNAGSTFWKQGAMAHRRDGRIERGLPEYLEQNLDEKFGALGAKGEWPGFTEDALAYYDTENPLPTPTLCDGQVWLIEAQAQNAVYIEALVLQRIGLCAPSLIWPERDANRWMLGGIPLRWTAAEIALLGAQRPQSITGAPLETSWTRTWAGWTTHAWLLSDPRHPSKNVYWSAPEAAP